MTEIMKIFGVINSEEGAKKKSTQLVTSNYWIECRWRKNLLVKNGKLKRERGKEKIIYYRSNHPFIEFQKEKDLHTEIEL